MGQFESDDAFEPATAAYIHLRDLIVSVVLLPGDELQRDALEKFYGRAAPDVSSLVGKLADQHLVRTGAAGRIFVAPIDTTPLNDSLHFRAELEMEIVRCLAKRGARTVLSDTERLLAEDSAKHGGFDPVGSAALDRGFHATLFAAESMSCVWDVVLAMSANVDRARAIRRAVQGVHQEEHCTYVEIAAAIARQDSNTARSWMREHLRSDGLAELAEATNHSKSWLSVKLSHTQEIVRSNQMVWTPPPGLRQSRRFAGIVEGSRVADIHQTGRFDMKQLVIGMDIAKTVFQLHFVDTSGEVKRLKLQRNEVMPFFTQLAPAIVAMEACGGAHEWGRKLSALGHQVKLLAPKSVRPFVQRNKTDAADAKASWPCIACASN